MSKELTTLQTSFLNALFGEAQGDPNKAKVLAGYSEDSSTLSIVRSLKKEILELTKLNLALSAPQAAAKLIEVALNDQVEVSPNRLKAIQDILNRVGAEEKAEANVSVNIPQGGIVIMPAKGANHSLKQDEVIDAEYEEMSQVRKEN